MDPFLLSLAWAIAAGISTVAGRLIDKGIVEPALESATEQLKRLVQAGVKGIEKDDALMCSILAAIEDASKQKGESLAVKYAERLRLHVITEPGNEEIRDECMCLVYLASSEEDPHFVPDSLLDLLHLAPSERPALGRFLFYLRRHLATLPDFRPLLEEAHNQAAEAISQEMSLSLLALASTVKPRPEGAVLCVQVVESEWNPGPYLRYLEKVCNVLPLERIASGLMA